MAPTELSTRPHRVDETFYQALERKGLSRRDFLTVGTLASAGLTLADLLRAAGYPVAVIEKVADETGAECSSSAIRVFSTWPKPEPGGAQIGAM